MNIQSEIVEAVRARGYLEGWTNEQLAARQAMKLAEELRELIICDGEIGGEYNSDTWHRNVETLNKIDYAGRAARESFDDGDCGKL
jgi:hypothetical protein